MVRRINEKEESVNTHSLSLKDAFTCAHTRIVFDNDERRERERDETRVPGNTHTPRVWTNDDGFWRRRIKRIMRKEQHCVKGATNFQRKSSMLSCLMRAWPHSF